MNSTTTAAILRIVSESPTGWFMYASPSVKRRTARRVPPKRRA